MDVKRIKQYSKYMRHREKREGGGGRQTERDKQTVRPTEAEADRGREIGRAIEMDR